MGTPSFSLVHPEDEQRALATLLLAFAGDPVERWLYPEPQQYLTEFPRFLAAFGGPAFAQRTVWQAEDFAAVALWLAPGSEPDAARIVNVLSDGVSDEQHVDTFDVLEQMGAAHPRYPHWYLPWLGVDPGAQGQGLGSRLLEECLTRVDADRLPAYLETPNPRTIAFYERHGFDVVGTAQSGACPRLTFMLRMPQ